MKIALIAHDNKKADLVAFILKRLDFFNGVDLLATGTTGKHVRNAGLTVGLMKMAYR
jgi:methylglyoxal synthase